MDEKNNEITNEIQPGSEIPILCLAGFFLLPHLVAFLCTFALPFETGSWGAFGTVFSIAALPTPITTPIGLAILIVADLSGGICKYRNYVVYACFAILWSVIIQFSHKIHLAYITPALFSILFLCNFRKVLLGSSGKLKITAGIFILLLTILLTVCFFKHKGLVSLGSLLSWS